MNMKIKLRRRWYGQDGWGAFVEEIAVRAKLIMEVINARLS